MQFDINTCHSCIYFLIDSYPLYIYVPAVYPGISPLKRYQIRGYETPVFAVL